MADFTVSRPAEFPNGTVLDLYNADTLPQNGDKPLGHALASQTVAGGSATFTGLDTGIGYIVFARGTVKSLRFRVPLIVVPEDISAELAAHEADTTGVHGIPDTSMLVADQGFINVRENGATGDGVTDDTAAIQAVLDSIPAQGATVYFPLGTYLVTNLVLPYGRVVRLIGASAGFQTSIGSRILRKAGYTGYFIVGVGVGLSPASARGVYEIRNLCFDGAGIQQPGVAFADTNQSIIQDCEFVNIQDIGLSLQQYHNGRVQGCFIHTCGLGAAKPAMYLGPATGGASDTVHFNDIEWEANRGTDLKIDGNPSGTPLPTTNVAFSNLKFENSQDANAYPCPFIHVTLGQLLMFTNVQITVNTPRTAPPVKVEASATGAGEERSNKFVNMTIDNILGAFTYHFEILGHTVQLANCEMLGAVGSGGKHIHIGSSVRRGGFQATNLKVGDPANVVQDDRTLKDSYNVVSYP